MSKRAKLQEDTNVNIVDNSAIIATNEPIKIGVFTSGGDSQGMNACVRAITRLGLARGLEVYAIYEGMQGLVDGNFKRLVSSDVARIIHIGGTVLGTKRCKAFYEKPGRFVAVRNLVKAGITNIICIGGDGSLTGCNMLREEWGEHLSQLVTENVISKDVAAKYSELRIVGITGSIDNDFSGTDFTIGAASALERIVTNVDDIVATAISHQRVFIVETMGRHCGYLALTSALATGADWVLLPEFPPPEGWEDIMMKMLERGRDVGKRHGLVIISEGANDIKGNPITSNYVNDYINKHGWESRVSVLGHIQRGGQPCAFDRTLATLTGAAAVDAIIDKNQKPCVVSYVDNQIVLKPLMECVKMTQSVQAAIVNKEYEKAMALRGGDFRVSFDTLRMFRRVSSAEDDGKIKKVFLRIGVINIGAPTPGMNAAVRAAVTLGQEHGHTLLGIRNGFTGLIADEVTTLTRGEVANWVFIGGSKLCCCREVPNDGNIDAIASALKRHKIDALLIIGGFEGFTACTKFLQYSINSNFDSVRNGSTNGSRLAIPIVLIPATISNNVPGTEISIGCDTAVNVVMEAGDRIKQSADATRRRVFIIETQGRHSGYLSCMGALVMGAEWCYLPEDHIDLTRFCNDVKILKSYITESFQHGLVIVNNEYSNKTFNTQLICDIFNEESNGFFTASSCVLGHLQQGGAPSALDRILATRWGMQSIYQLENQALASHKYPTVLGQIGNKVVFTPISDLISNADFEKRIPKQSPWWIDRAKLVTLLASSYSSTQSLHTTSC